MIMKDDCIVFSLSGRCSSCWPVQNLLQYLAKQLILLIHAQVHTVRASFLSNIEVGDWKLHNHEVSLIHLIAQVLYSGLKLASVPDVLLKLGPV